MTPSGLILLKNCRRDRAGGHEVAPVYVPVANELLEEGLIRYEMKGRGKIRYPVLYLTPEGEDELMAEETRGLLACP